MSFETISRYTYPHYCAHRSRAIANDLEPMSGLNLDGIFFSMRNGCDLFAATMFQFNISKMTHMTIPTKKKSQFIVPSYHVDNELFDRLYMKTPCIRLSQVDIRRFCWLSFVQWTTDNVPHIETQHFLFVCQNQLHCTPSWTFLTWKLLLTVTMSS